MVETISGKVTVEELREKFISLFTDPDYDESMRGLCDMRQARSEMNRDDLRQFSNEVEATTNFGQSRWAIVVEDPVLTALAQIFQRNVGAEGKIQVFSTLEAAEDHVGARLRAVLSEL